MTEIETQDDIIEPEETDEAAADDVKDDKGKDTVEKPKETPEAKEARLTRQLKQVRKQLGKDVEEEKPKPVEKTTVSKTGELDETQLDYLDLKGVTDEDEIAVIQKVMKNTGQTVRQVLKDDYVQSKLTALRKEREVKDATPSGTRRAGGQASNDVDYWVAKAEQGELPKDPELKRKVLQKLDSKKDLSIPPWRR